MKIRLLTAALLTALLAGCGAPAGTGEQEIPSPQLSSAPVTIPAARLELPPMTEEEVLRSYDLAVEAWSWFELTPLAHEATGIELNGEIYWQVRSPRFKTIQDLREHLRRFFSVELTERLLDQESGRPLYREQDGVLYVRSGGRERDATKGTRQISAERESDTCYSVNVTVDLLEETSGTVEGLEFWSFPYVLEGDRWVFTDFQLID